VVLCYIHSLSAAGHWGLYAMSPSTCFLQTDNLHNLDDLFYNASKVLHTTQGDIITKMHVSVKNYEGKQTDNAFSVNILKVK
jgi:hypothetical protein